MALTVTPVTQRQSIGNYFEKIVDVTFDSSYPTGGEALTAATLGFASILSVTADPIAGTTVRTAVYDRANSKLLAYDPDGGQIADTTDIATISARLIVRGTG